MTCVSSLLDNVAALLGLRASPRPESLGMALGLPSLSSSISIRGFSLSLYPSSRFLHGEASLSLLFPRSPFQASASRARAKFPALDERCGTILSKVRRPIEDVEDQGEEGAVDEHAERFSSISSSSFLSLTEKPDRSLTVLDDYELEELDYVQPSSASHRSGYVAVLGKPNVGKSTLSNQMIGQKLSIVTDKPQTTRHRILGICSGADYQIILYDTPGVIEKRMHKLDSMMMKNVRTAAINADCVLVVVDACKVPKQIDEILDGMGALKGKVPILLVLNKKDLIKPGEITKRLEWYEKFAEVDEVIPVSAKYGSGVDDVKDWILSKIPQGPAYYPKGITSEHPERFFVSEIIREKIFMQYRNEVPYACQVNIVNYISRPTAKDFIQVEVVVEKNSQKIILIGKDGKALKILAIASRLDIEDFLQKKVFLEVEVKVKENWRQDEGLLKNYGYDGQIRVI